MTVKGSGSVQCASEMKSESIPIKIPEQISNHSHTCPDSVSPANYPPGRTLPKSMPSEFEHTLGKKCIKKFTKRRAPKFLEIQKECCLRVGKMEEKSNLQPSRNLAEKLQVGTLWRHPVTACDSLADINIGMIV